jgi:hypothetical protein
MPRRNVSLLLYAVVIVVSIDKILSSTSHGAANDSPMIFPFKMPIKNCLVERVCVFRNKLLASKNKSEEDDTLEYGLPDDVLEHGLRNNVVFSTVWLSVEELFSWRLSC